MLESEARTTADYPICVDALPTITLQEARYEVRFARSGTDLDAILRLRYEVFNLELGEGLEAAHATGQDRDMFDAVCHHLLVTDLRTQEIVGTYRMQTGGMARDHHGFYSATEFDLASLPGSVMDDAVEVGRACVAAGHRNTAVLFLLWKGLATYMATNHKRYLFGCCSLTSQDPREGRAVMDYLLRHDHVHTELWVAPLPGLEAYDPNLEPDPSFAVKLPKLFRIYLRHGAVVCGPPAIDRHFKTIDYLVIFDIAAMDERMVKTYFS